MYSTTSAVEPEPELPGNFNYFCAKQASSVRWIIEFQIV